MTRSTSPLNGTNKKNQSKRTIQNDGVADLAAAHAGAREAADVAAPQVHAETEVIGAANITHRAVAQDLSIDNQGTMHGKRSNRGEISPRRPARSAFQT